MLKTLIKFLRLRGSSSIFDRGYTIQFELNGLGRPKSIPGAGLRIETEICYHPQPDENRSLQALDIYAPPPEQADGTVPVILFFHGGGWRASDKNDPLGVHANLCKALARKGLVAVNGNYRLAPRVKHPDSAQDAAYALRWVAENIGKYSGDSEQVFLSGHSAGAHLAALITLDTKYLSALGLSPDIVTGVVGICGAYNLHHFAGRNWMAEHLMTRAAFGKNKADRTEASPVNHVRPGAPPFLMLNAEKDEKLEEEAEELAALLRARGSAAETAILPGTNHFTILSLIGNGDDTLIDRIVNFVQGKTKDQRPKTKK
ncbi:MAG: alpha/beta hydrolase [Pyrinomonadaceae bacterium]